MSNAEDATALLRGNKLLTKAQETSANTSANKASSVPQEGDGIGILPEGDLIPSGEALQLLLDKDPLQRTNQDLDRIIAYQRDHQRRLAEGALKKGQRPSRKAPKAPAKKKAANAQEEPDNSQED